MNVLSTMEVVNKFVLMMWVLITANVITDTLVQTIILVMVSKLITKKSGLSPCNAPTSTTRYSLLTLH